MTSPHISSDTGSLKIEGPRTAVASITARGAAADTLSSGITNIPQPTPKSSETQLHGREHFVVARFFGCLAGRHQTALIFLQCEAL